VTLAHAVPRGPRSPPPLINCLCRLPRSIASARSQLHATRVIADAGAVDMECVSHVTYHMMSHVTRHMLHVTRHRSQRTEEHVTRHMSHVTGHKEQRNMSRVTCHTSHVTRQTRLTHNPPSHHHNPPGALSPPTLLLHICPNASLHKRARVIQAHHAKWRRHTPLKSLNFCFDFGLRERGRGRRSPQPSPRRGHRAWRLGMFGVLFFGRMLVANRGLGFCLVFNVKGLVFCSGWCLKAPGDCACTSTVTPLLGES